MGARAAMNAVMLTSAASTFAICKNDIMLRGTNAGTKGAGYYHTAILGSPLTGLDSKLLASWYCGMVNTTARLVNVIELAPVSVKSVMEPILKLFMADKDKTNADSIWKPTHFQSAFPGIALLARMAALLGPRTVGSASALFTIAGGTLSMTPEMQNAHMEFTRYQWNSVIKGAKSFDSSWYELTRRDALPLLFPFFINGAVFFEELHNHPFGRHEAMCLTMAMTVASRLTPELVNAVPALALNWRWSDNTVENAQAKQILHGAPHRKAYYVFWASLQGLNFSALMPGEVAMAKGGVLTKVFDILVLSGGGSPKVDGGVIISAAPDGSHDKGDGNGAVSASPAVTTPATATMVTPPFVTPVVTPPVVNPPNTQPPATDPNQPPATNPGPAQVNPAWWASHNLTESGAKMLSDRLASTTMGSPVIFADEENFKPFTTPEQAKNLNESLTPYVVFRTGRQEVNLDILDDMFSSSKEVIEKVEAFSKTLPLVDGAEAEMEAMSKSTFAGNKDYAFMTPLIFAAVDSSSSFDDCYLHYDTCWALDNSLKGKKGALGTKGTLVNEAETYLRCRPWLWNLDPSSAIILVMVSINGAKTTTALRSIMEARKSVIVRCLDEILS